MKLLIKRYANVRSDVVGFAQVGSDALTLLKKGEDLTGILNGCEILKTDLSGGSRDKVSCLVGKVLAQLCNKNGSDQIVLYKSHWKHREYPAEDLLNSVVPRIDPNVKVDVRSYPRVEIKNFLPMPRIASVIDSENLYKNLNVFSRKISNASIVLGSAIRGAYVVTGKKLIGSMWGAKKTQNYLDEGHKVIASLNRDADAASMHQELIRKGIGRLQRCMKEASLSSESRKMVAQVVIPSIVDSYEMYKKIASKVMLEIAPLLYIDEVFRGNTQYPASWFISEETMENMREDFEHLASFIGEVPAIESKVVIPLDMLGSQITK